MTDCLSDYTAHYRWEWFRRNEWRKSFRERKRHSSGAFVKFITERGWQREPVLDCSCGLGLKTIVLREAGLNVQGSDVCPAAVEYARLLTGEEGHPDLHYFVSSWSELPQTTETRYAAVFNDALSWVYSDDAMAAALTGLHDCLRPGGVLAYMGALPGTNTDQVALLNEEWQTKTADGRHCLGIAASVDGTSVQEVITFEKGPDYIDEHHLYVVEEDGSRRLERWCLRCALKWSWPRMQTELRATGFHQFDTVAFSAANGKPFHLVLAVRD